MKPSIHARNSVKRYGGAIEDYQKYHDWFDATKAAYPDIRHRAILHNSFGIFLLESIYGITFKNSDGKTVDVRSIGEDHCIEDNGKILTIKDWFKNMQVPAWMNNRAFDNLSLCESSVAKFGGSVNDYSVYHDFIDSANGMDARFSQAVLHNSYTEILMKQKFNTDVMTNSDNVRVPLAAILHLHCELHFGFTPSIQDWMELVSREKWMMGVNQQSFTKRTVIPLDDSSSKRADIIAQKRD